jgi:hypothetical protein
MSAPVRFLAVAVFGWITVRATGEVLMVEPLPPVPVPAPATPLLEMAELGSHAVPAQATYQQAAPMPVAGPHPYAAMQPGYAQPYARPVPMPFYYPVAAPVSRYAAVAMPHARHSESGWATDATGPGPDFSDMPAADAVDEPQLAFASPTSGFTPRRTVPSFAGTAPTHRATQITAPRLDRLSLSAWALVRQPSRTLIDPRLPVTAPAGLAAGGQLGGSQAGARLTYRFNPQLAANLRVSAPINSQTQTRMAGEAALGVSWQPLTSLPIRVMAERRQAWGGPAGGGRNAFAVLAEGGVYDQRLPWNFRLDGYGQAGAVSVRDKAWFVDGGATVSRPLFGRFALGAGAWGGAQQGLTRLDVGPRMSMQLFPGIRTHLDYRYRLVGKAEPGSGWAVTVGADF